MKLLAAELPKLSLLHVTSEDIEEVAGSQQLCVGQPAGAEAVVHAIRESFQNDDIY